MRAAAGAQSRHRHAYSQLAPHQVQRARRIPKWRALAQGTEERFEGAATTVRSLSGKSPRFGRIRLTDSNFRTWPIVLS